MRPEPEKLVESEYPWKINRDNLELLQAVTMLREDDWTLSLETVRH